jgi:predicted Zn-dependent protease
VIRAALLVSVLASCSANAHYLGAPLPASCSKGDVERCAGWMAERDLVAGQLDVYNDPDLRAYVQRITDRLAQGAGLANGPRIVIANHEGTYAAYGERIVVGRMAIEKLSSEAELAAIVAHELAHVEGHHASMSLFGPDADALWLAARRDAEAIADERAVTLLERAGYTPSAMSRALAASLDADDEEHPPKADRLDAVE